MVEVPWNGLRSVSFAVGVIGTLDFVGGLGDARGNSSRPLAGGGEICWVVSRDRLHRNTRSVLHPFNSFSRVVPPFLSLQPGLYLWKWDDTGRNWFITVQKVYTRTNTIIPVQKGLA
jgi:hypothetical protein